MTSEPAKTNTSEPTKIETPRLKFLADGFIKNCRSARSCFVLGATGETGRRIASLLIESGAFSVVKLIVRRQIAEEYLPEPAEGVRIVNNFKGFHLL